MFEETFPADDSKLPEVIELVESELERVGCPLQAMMQISVATEELFVNIAHYAYPNGSGSMTLYMNADEEKAELKFVDEGIPFNPIMRDDPDVAKVAEDESVGGLGILMVKKTMDAVNYERLSQKNVLTILKRFG